MTNTQAATLQATTTRPRAAAAPARRSLTDTGPLLVLGFALLLLAITWTAIPYRIAADRDLAIQAAIKENANLARAFEEHIVRTLRGVDQVALFVKDQYERQGMALDLARYAREGSITGRIYNQIGVIDERGEYVLSSLQGFKPINLSDREHFRVHVGRDSGELFIGKPVLGRASGKWSIQMSRRINRPDGSFGGVVVVSVDPFYFSDFYRQVDLGSRGVVTLVGLDGVVRARQSGEDVTVGQDLARAPLFRNLPQRKSGHYEQDSLLDGVRRVICYRALADYPFVVTVGTAVDDILSEFHARRTAYLGGAVALTLMVLAFTAALLVLIERNRRIREDLELARAQAESANHLKSEFLASMSHELRTPLNGVLGFAEFLRNELADPRHARFASVIHTSGRHLLELVNSILDLAKIEAGRMELAVSEEPLRPVLEDTVAGHAGAARVKGFECRLEAAADLPATIRCDRTRLVQVLNNLLHNGVKFTDRGEVVLSVSRHGAQLRFEVRDTGPGIPEGAQATIFDRFVQGEGFLTRRHAGTGLGLALARELVTLMGGTIGVASTPGAGSTFHFTIPLEPPAP